MCESRAKTVGLDARWELFIIYCKKITTTEGDFALLATAEKL